MGQHMASGYESDCCGYLFDVGRNLLRARRHQGPGVPGQQNSWWTGRRTDDCIRAAISTGHEEGDMVTDDEANGLIRYTELWKAGRLYL